MVAAALAQLGWPYVWGGESRAEGGFDCSGLVDYAFAAAGRPLGRLTAAGLQGSPAPLPAGAALRPAISSSSARPPITSASSSRPGLAVEAPHRGALVHVEPIARRRLDGRRARSSPPTPPSSRRRLPELAVPAYVPSRFRPLIARAARAEQLPPALLAAQLEAESGFDATARSPAGAEGIAQFMPATWSGSWKLASSGRFRTLAISLTSQTPSGPKYPTRWSEWSRSRHSALLRQLTARLSSGRKTSHRASELH